MDLGRPDTTTEEQALISMVNYYRYMCPRRSHVLDTLTEAASGYKCRRMLCNNALESSFKEIKRMVSAETLLSYPYWKIPFTVHTDASDKQLCDVISQKDKPIDFFSRIFRKPKRNYTTTDKEILAILECLKQFRGILFGYEINVLSDHKNMVYVATLSESQRVMLWKLIIKEFDPNIQHIYGVDNIVAYMLIKLPSTPSDMYKSCKSKA